MSHCRLVHVCHFYGEVLRHTEEEVLSKFEEVVFSKLLNLLSAFHFVGVAARFDRERIDYVEVAEDAQPRTVLLVLFISKLAVVVLEVGRDVVENHGEALDHGLLRLVFVHRGVAKD